MSLTESLCETAYSPKPFPEIEVISTYDIRGQELVSHFILTFLDCEEEHLSKSKSPCKWKCMSLSNLL